MKINTKDMMICSICVSIICILAQISIIMPITNVPFTMQVFGVSIVAVVLGSKLATICTLIYIMIGAIGLPVFSNMTGGMNIVFGPTGGFILSFPIMAYIIGFASEKTNNRLYLFIYMLIAMISSYIGGMIQFSMISNVGLDKAFALCVMPFIIPDILKLIVASILGVSIKSKLNKVKNQ